MMDYTTLISSEELSHNLEDPNWAVFDMRFDLADKEQGLQEYLAGHIPGAIYVHLEDDLSLPASSQGGRHPLPSVGAMEKTFSQWGIDGSTQVVVYDARGGGFAARLWWMLRYLGHHRVALLNGGFPAWTGAGLPIQSGQESRKVRKFKAEVQDEMLVGSEDVLQSIDDPNTILIDARSPARHQGLEEPIDRLAGHIPGATNRFWQHNLNENGIFLPKETLQKEWQELLQGIPPEAAIVHCGSGVTGCQNILAMTYAGLEGSKLYVGSWSQWLEDPDLPKVLGTNRQRSSESE
jgi:thiosulfate/3-mercaptopyruvate sulfurtransferase